SRQRIQIVAFFFIPEKMTLLVKDIDLGTDLRIPDIIGAVFGSRDVSLFAGERNLTLIGLRDLATRQADDPLNRTRRIDAISGILPRVGAAVENERGRFSPCTRA